MIRVLKNTTNNYALKYIVVFFDAKYIVVLHLSVYSIVYIIIL